jgi:hypothetical protein
MKLRERELLVEIVLYFNAGAVEPQVSVLWFQSIGEERTESLKIQHNRTPHLRYSPRTARVPAHHSCTSARRVNY